LLLGANTAIAAHGKISGQVTLNGKLLGSGRVLFHLPNGQFVGSKIKDGTFAIDELPEGKHAITVEGKEVPEKYSDDESSVLQFDTKSGENLLDIDLRSE